MLMVSERRNVGTNIHNLVELAFVIFEITTKISKNKKSHFSKYVSHKLGQICNLRTKTLRIWPICCTIFA